MKIRVKVKHLVIAAVSILTFIPLLMTFIIPNLELYLAEKKIISGKVEDKQEILELLSTTSINKKWEIIQQYMIEDGYTGKFDIYISPSMTSWEDLEARVMDFSWEEKLPFIIDFVENGPLNENLVTAAKTLAFYYERIGEVEKAKSTLYQVSTRLASNNYSYEREELLIERIRIAKNHGQWEEVNQYSQEMEENSKTLQIDSIAQLAQLKAEMLLQQGDSEEAYQEVTKAIKQYEEDYKIEREKWSDSDDEITLENYPYYQRLKSFEQTLSVLKARGGVGKVVKISGRVVKSDGTPLKNIGVFLKEESDKNHTIRPDEKYQTLTDNDGYYEFKGVIPNNYQLAIGVHYEQISGWTWVTDMYDTVAIDGSKDDVTYDITLQKLIAIKTPVNEEELVDNTVHFEWEEVEGASYYELGFGYEIDGGWIGTGSISNIKESQADIPVEDIYNLQGGVAFGDTDIVSPKSLLAYTHPENRYYWKVAAYDENGKIITKSDGALLDDQSYGNLPFFYLKQRELTTTDQLLIDGKIQEALNEYKENYKQNPDDLHSLRMIIRLIGIEEDHIHDRDELAISYMEDLAMKAPSPFNIHEVFLYYFNQRDWELFHKWFELYRKQVDILDEYDQSLYATVLMMKGQHREASSQFAEAMAKQGDNRYVGYWLANELYLNDDFNHALEIAIEYPPYGYGEIVPNWVQLVSKMAEESKQSKAYHQEMREILTLYFANQEEEMAKWRRETEFTNLKKFINALDDVN